MGSVNDKDIDFFVTNDFSQETYDSSKDGAFIYECGENKKNLYIGDNRITDNFNVTADSTLKTIEVGGLEASTIGDLKNKYKSMSDILFQIVCPDIKPTVVSEPSVAISYSKTLMSVGDSLPEQSGVKVVANRGKFSNDNDYAGEPVITLTMDPDKWGQPGEEGVYKITAKAVFAEGKVPESSHGKNCDDLQYKGGEISSNKTITVVKPIYISNGNDISVMNERIVDYISGFIIEDIKTPGEKDGGYTNKFRVYLPGELSKFVVMQKNPTTQKYDIEVSMSSFDDPDYAGYACYVRTKTDTDTKGSAEYRIELKK